ncbi:hypothetical protein K469DRAFT_18729 [Zopfia rhizophila CBS 207.26]|uniref:Uncharacterized protein n=1 Tax=Zopfia rhizophila CBS 207.26 TaxID=1314779 RepID=A0A6A6EW41_9PEZI|nr:hypothetical protein K469DRAFT_18729 [Zopfia rhizophila CBS 207.26]
MNWFCNDYMIDCCCRESDLLVGHTISRLGISLLYIDSCCPLDSQVLNAILFSLSAAQQARFTVTTVLVHSRPNVFTQMCAMRSCIVIEYAKLIFSPSKHPSPNIDIKLALPIIIVFAFSYFFLSLIFNSIHKLLWLLNPALYSSQNSLRNFKSRSENMLFRTTNATLKPTSDAEVLHWTCV